MANELHIPHPIVSVLYTFLQLAVSFGLILTGSDVAGQWIYSTAVILALAGMYLLFMHEYYHLHEQYLRGLGTES